MKDLADKLYSKNLIKHAIIAYQSALNNLPKTESEQILRRNIFSNLSLMHYKINEFGKAINSANCCILSDSTWFKVRVCSDTH